jgi:hypothetical protein
LPTPRLTRRKPVTGELLRANIVANLQRRQSDIECRYGIAVSPTIVGSLPGESHPADAERGSHEKALASHFSGPSGNGRWIVRRPTVAGVVSLASGRCLSAGSVLSVRFR